MRIAIGGLHHETNTFNAVPTDLRAFQTGLGATYRGEEILSAFNGTRTVIGGFIDASRRYNFELIPTFYAQAGLNTGTVTREAFEYLEGQLIKEIRKAEADGVLLFLHGAMVAEGYDDPTGHTLKMIRKAVGKTVPIVMVHDLHGNITRQWVEEADVILGFKTAPHVDMYDRGLEGGKVLMSILRDGLRPTMALEKPPILVGGGLMTIVDQPLSMIKAPMHHLVALAREMEREEGVVNVTVAAGFGHADVPDAGLGIVVTTDNAPELAKEKAKQLGDLAWKLRRDFLADRVLVPLDVAMRRALAAEGGPVILADQGNNTAGGSPGDGTTLLGALKEAGWPDAALFICDPEAVKKAIEAGVTGEVEMLVGGKTDRLHGEPVKVKGRVKLISDGKFVSLRERAPVKMGRTVVLECGATHLVLTDYPTSQTEPKFFQSVGIEPSEKKILVVQSAHLFRHYFEPMAKMIMEVDTPGITSPNLPRFTFRKVRRPIFPLDDI